MPACRLSRRHSCPGGPRSTSYANSLAGCRITRFSDNEFSVNFAQQQPDEYPALTCLGYIHRFKNLNPARHFLVFSALSPADLERAQLDSISSQQAGVKANSLDHDPAAPRGLLVPFVAISCAAFLVILPFFFYGIPSGHDFEFHMNSWMEVLGQWKLGVLHPQWSALAHYGYGEARFVFYPPASWTLGALLGLFLPWKLVTGAYVWIALTASGLSMFFLAREWLERTEAIYAALFYVANPYFLVVIYWRSAFAELLAGALIPLLVLAVFRPKQNACGMVLPLALIVAAAWLINVPSAVMVTYSAAFFVLALALSRHSFRVSAEGAAGILLGMLLAGFYLVPAIYEQKWINVSQVLSEGYRAQDNFLFAVTADPDHNLFNHLISIVALSEVIVLCITGFLALRRKPRARFFSVLAIWGAALCISMFSVTNLFWRHLPELRFMQFPWRWLLCLNVPLAIFIARASRRWIPRIALYLLLLAAVVYVWHTVQAPWWDSSADIAEMLDNQTSGVGYEGTDEYVPAGADASAAKPATPDVKYKGAGSAQIAVQRWNPELRSFTVAANAPGTMAIRLFNFPAWKVRMNDRLMPSETDPETGQMMVPVQSGTNHVEIRFTKTWDRTLGEIVSAITAIFLLLLAVIQRKMSLREISENQSYARS